jgi:hypothetical protein
MPEPMIQGERVLSGPEKAAALLLMMGRPPAARLLKHFDPPHLRAVARAAAGLGAVAPTTLDRLVEEFATDFSAGANLLGDLGQARNLLAEALPPNEVDDVLDSALGEGKELSFGKRSHERPRTPSSPSSSLRDPRPRPISSPSSMLRLRPGSSARCRESAGTQLCAGWSRNTR